jgi:acyl-CoA dehydrogenase
VHNIFWFCLWLLALGALSYHKIALINSASCIIIALFVSFFLGGISALTLCICVVLAVGISYCLINSNFRRNYISKPLLAKIQSNLPKISKTESEALQAGTVWWDGELFSGNPNWKKLLKVPTPHLTVEEQNFLNGPVEQLCRMIDNWQINQQLKDLPPEIWTFIKQEKFFGLMIPKEYNGLGFSALAHSDILAKIAGKSITVASTVSVPNSLGPAELLLHYGTKDQKDHYLANLACGKEVPCFALTSPEAGSDATSITDTGIICEQIFNSKKTLGILLNWNKRYITLAPIATVMGLAFKLYDPDNHLGKGTDLGITCALIPTTTPGIIIGDRHWPLAAMFQNGPIHGKNVFIPIDWIIGGPEMAGKGWIMLIESLSCGRAISLPSVTAGKAKTVAAATGAYAKIRRQFNQPIGSFEGVEEPLARIASNLYICDGARRITAASIDTGEKPTVPGAIVKYHVTERTRHINTDAMDIHGGKGIMQGPKNYLADGYINAPIAITVEGANILTRSLIIFGQGAIRCHPYIMRELNALQDESPSQVIIKFDQVIMQHAGYTLSNCARALFGCLTHGMLIHAPVSHSAARYFKWVSWASSSFAVLADASLIVLGGKLKYKEKLSARLGDLLSMLYLASTTLKRFEDEGHQEADLVLLEWSIKDLLHTFWSTVDEILQNFPNRAIAFGLRMIVMPLGIPIKKPSDQLGNKVAQLLLQPNATRDRLLDGAYLSANDLNPVGQLEIALKHIIAAEEIEKRMGKAIRDGVITGITAEEQVNQALNTALITETEATILNKAVAARAEVVAVDYFASKSMAAEQGTIYKGKH